MRAHHQKPLEISNGAIGVGREIFRGLGGLGEELGPRRLVARTLDGVVVELEEIVPALGRTIGELQPIARPMGIGRELEHPP
jgi:hypothetical protein